MNLRVDSSRLHRRKKSGILVLAIDENGRRDAIDIVYLSKESLLEWLREKPSGYIESVVLALLGHSRKEDASCEP